VAEAYDRLEALEHVAQVLFLARNLGDVAPLTPEQLQRLRNSVEARGLTWRYPDKDDLGSLKDEIVRRVLQELK